MDGVTGVFGVVSLAIQLVDTIQEIRHFVQKVAQASTKHQSLIAHLNSLEILLEGVKTVSKRDDCNGATIFSESIRFATINCHKKLKTLHQFIEHTRSATDGKGKIHRTLGAVKLAFKDEDIREFDSSLHQAVVFLTAALALSTRDAQYRDSNNIMSALRTVIDELVRLRSEVNPRKQSINPETGADEQTYHARDYKSQSGYSLQASRRKTNIVTCHKSFLGTVLVRQVETTVSFDADHEHRRHAARTQIETNWSILPSFLSRYIDFQFQSTSRSVFRNLRVYNVIDDKDPVWSICCAEDGRTLRSYMDNNRDKVDPFVVDSLGNSLFHAAALCKNHETCKVLLELGVDPTAVVNEDGHDALYWLGPYSPAYPHKGITPELTFRLIVAHFPDCVEGEVLQFWHHMNIESFEVIIETWVNLENINLFNDSPLLCAMKSLQWSPPWPEKLRWIKANQKLIKMGADIHQFSKSSKVSLLHEVLGIAKEPWDVPEAFNFWILILVSSGVNITRYLRVEVDFYYDNGPIFIPVEDPYELRRRITLEVHADGDAHFGWEWWLEPCHPGYELAKEFNLLDASLFHASKEPSLNSDDYDYKQYMKVADERRHSQQLREERFWSKKAAKAAKAKRKQDVNPTRLPGAWID